jgi:hypothetical protein
MKLFFVNLFAKDTTNCRGLPPSRHEGFPWSCFTYVVMASSAEHAEQTVMEQKSDMPAHWVDKWCFAQDTDGTECDTAVFIDCCEISEENAWNIRRSRGKTKLQEHG